MLCTRVSVSIKYRGAPHLLVHSSIGSRVNNGLMRIVRGSNGTVSMRVDPKTEDGLCMWLNLT